MSEVLSCNTTRLNWYNVSGDLQRYTTTTDGSCSSRRCRSDDAERGAQMLRMTAEQFLPSRARRAKKSDWVERRTERNAVGCASQWRCDAGKEAGRRACAARRQKRRSAAAVLGPYKSITLFDASGQGAPCAAVGDPAVPESEICPAGLRIYVDVARCVLNACRCTCGFTLVRRPREAALCEL